MQIIINGKDVILKAVEETEHHFHTVERWFGKAVSASGETHVADRLGAGVAAFRLTAGNNTWGAWVQLLGSSDTPADTGKVYYDPHRIEITVASNTASYFIQIAAGATGDVALAAGEYTEFPYTPNTNQIDAGPVIIKTDRYLTGTKLWARCLCLGQNATTIDMYIGLHEYTE